FLLLVLLNLIPIDFESHLIGHLLLDLTQELLGDIDAFTRRSKTLEGVANHHLLLVAKLCPAELGVLTAIEVPVDETRDDVVVDAVGDLVHDGPTHENEHAVATGLAEGDYLGVIRSAPLVLIKEGRKDALRHLIVV